MYLGRDGNVMVQDGMDVGHAVSNTVDGAALQEFKEHKVGKVHKVIKEPRETRVHKDSREPKATRVLRVIKVHKESKELKDSWEPKATKVHKATKAPREFKEPKVGREPRVTREPKEIKEHREFKVHKDSAAHKVFLVQLLTRTSRVVQVTYTILKEQRDNRTLIKRFREMLDVIILCLVVLIFTTQIMNMVLAQLIQLPIRLGNIGLNNNTLVGSRTSELTLVENQTIR